MKLVIGSIFLFFVLAVYGKRSTRKDASPIDESLYWKTRSAGEKLDTLRAKGSKVNANNMLKAGSKKLSVQLSGKERQEVEEPIINDEEAAQNTVKQSAVAEMNAAEDNLKLKKYELKDAEERAAKAVKKVPIVANVEKHLEEGKERGPVEVQKAHEALTTKNEELTIAKTEADAAAKKVKILTSEVEAAKTALEAAKLTVLKEKVKEEELKLNAAQTSLDEAKSHVAETNRLKDEKTRLEGVQTQSQAAYDAATDQNKPGLKPALDKATVDLTTATSDLNKQEATAPKPDKIAKLEGDVTTAEQAVAAAKKAVEDATKTQDTTSPILPHCSSNRQCNLGTDIPNEKKSSRKAACDKKSTTPLGQAGMLGCEFDDCENECKCVGVCDNEEPDCTTAKRTMKNKPCARARRKSSIKNKKRRVKGILTATYK